MANLSGTLPETQAAYQNLTAALASRGITARVADYGGVRTLADTNQILQYRTDDYTAAVNAGEINPAVTSLQRFRPISPYGSSYHNYGAAFDLLIIARPAGMTEAQALALAGGMAPAYGLRWGGTFTNPDTPHFELAIPLATAQAKYAAMTGGKQSAPSALNLPDISAFVPFLTSGDTGSTDDLPSLDTIDLSGASTDDSGEAYLEPDATANALGIDPQQTELIALGILVAGIVAWAVHRRFFG